MKIITLGSGATGSSAIEDYLLGREDITSAPINQEFRLIQDPGGLIELHAAICFGFHMNRASAAIEAFKDLCDRCGRSKSWHPKGLNYRKTIKNFDEKVDRFINRITAVSYSGFPFCERSKLTKWQSYLYFRKLSKAKSKGSKPDIGTMRLPVAEDVFLKEAETFLNSLILDGEDGFDKPIVIEQGGSFWTPVSSTRYFGNRKVIVVTRDPRDIFSEILDDGFAYPGRDVELFSSWFQAMMKHLDWSEWEDDNVIHIKFEDFVLDYPKQKKLLDERLGLDVNISSSYNPKLSEKNIGKYKSIISENEAKFIESHLKQYLHY